MQWRIFSNMSVRIKMVVKCAVQKLSRFYGDRSHAIPAPITSIFKIIKSEARLDRIYCSILRTASDARVATAYECMRARVNACKIVYAPGLEHARYYRTLRLIAKFPSNAGLIVYIYTTTGPGFAQPML